MNERQSILQELKQEERTAERQKLLKRLWNLDHDEPEQETSTKARTEGSHPVGAVGRSNAVKTSA